MADAKGRLKQLTMGERGRISSNTNSREVYEGHSSREAR
jgi:hypothetical protein